MFNFFRQYKYSRVLIAKLFELYSFYSLRSVLVLAFVISLNFTDSDAFRIYTTFVVCGDIISIVGGYFGDKLLTRRIAWVLGTFFSIVGYFYSYLNFNFLGICIGLILAGVGMGLCRCNSNVIINDYIQNDVEPDLRHNHNGIFHIVTIVALMMGFIINGFVLKYFNHNLIFALSGFAVIVSLIIFVQFEWKNLKNELWLSFIDIKKPVISEKYLELNNQTIFNWIKLINTVVILIGSLIFSVGLYYVSQSENFKNHFLLKNIKVSIVILMIVLIIFLLRKSKNYIFREKQAIWSLILYIPFYLIYMAFEKQLDMSFSLFLFRVVDRDLFGWSVPPANISAFFSIFILLLSVFFFKKSIYSYFQHNTVLILGFVCSILHFIFIFVGCLIGAYFKTQVNIFFPVISLLFLALADLFILPRMYSLCRNIPEEIKSFSASLMMLSHGGGFYLAGLLAQLAAVNNVNKNQVSNSDLIGNIDVYIKSFGIFILINLLIVVTVFILNKIKIGHLLMRK